MTQLKIVSARWVSIAPATTCEQAIASEDEGPSGGETAVQTDEARECQRLGSTCSRAYCSVKGLPTQKRGGGDQCEASGGDRPPVAVEEVVGPGIDDEDHDHEDDEEGDGAELEDLRTSGEDARGTDREGCDEADHHRCLQRVAATENGEEDPGDEAEPDARMDAAVVGVLPGLGQGADTTLSISAHGAILSTRNDVRAAPTPRRSAATRRSPSAAASSRLNREAASVISASAPSPASVRASRGEVRWSGFAMNSASPSATRSLATRWTACRLMPRRRAAWGTLSGGSGDDAEQLPASLRLALAGRYLLTGLSQEPGELVDVRYQQGGLLGVRFDFLGHDRSPFNLTVHCHLG